MKKVFLYVILALTAASCSLDDGNQYSADELVPIESVVLPDTLDFQETYDFEITYERPTDCHAFLGYSYDSQENERTIAVINRIYYDENSNCQTLEDELITQTLSFEVLREDNYVFNFWQGVDDNGDSVFLTIEVPVRTE